MRTGTYEELDLSVVPAEEECLPAPYSDDAAARAECERYKAFLEEYFGTPPDGAYFRVKRNPYDDFHYYSVVVRYDTDDAEAVDFAFFCDDHTPATWADLERDLWKKSKITAKFDVMFPDEDGHLMTIDDGSDLDREGALNFAQHQSQFECCKGTPYYVIERKVLSDRAVAVAINGKLFMPEFSADMRDYIPQKEEDDDNTDS